MSEIRLIPEPAIEFDAIRATLRAVIERCRDEAKPFDGQAILLFSAMNSLVALGRLEEHVRRAA